MYRLIFFIIVFLCPQLSFSIIAQNEKLWFYPWANDINGLESENNVSLPVLLNGSNYRVLKVQDFQGSKINEIKASGKNVTVDFFYLPSIKNYGNKQILDLIVPIDTKLSMQGADAFFLLKFHGVNQGNEIINIQIRSDKKTYFFSKNVSVAKEQYLPNINLNVWSYFDYNYLVKGMKSLMLNDLINHNVNTLIIPPYVLPDVSNISQSKIDQLKGYLNNLSNRFKYYIIYFGGFQDRQDNIMTASWKKNYPLWIKTISKVFNDSNIPFDKVFLYPYDEPKGNSINKLDSLIQYTRELNIQNRFFTTLSNSGSEQLARKIDIVQVHSDVPGLLDEVLKNKGKLTSVWIYETNFSLSNIISPKKYLGMSYKASRYNSSGLGIWCYADVKREDLTEFSHGLGTWEFKTKRSSKDYDYSLIYRKNNVIYSSIRWEAVSFGLEEIFWLKLYEQRFGTAKKNQIISNLLMNKLTTDRWESIKLDLIN